jgi:hypothetical protein
VREARNGAHHHLLAHNCFNDDGLNFKRLLLRMLEPDGGPIADPDGTGAGADLDGTRDRMKAKKAGDIITNARSHVGAVPIRTRFGTRKTTPSCGSWPAKVRLQDRSAGSLDRRVIPSLAGAIVKALNFLDIREDHTNNKHWINPMFLSNVSIQCFYPMFLSNVCYLSKQVLSVPKKVSYQEYV